MNNLKALQVYYKRQKLQIVDGGFLVFKRKIMTLLGRLAHHMPLAFGVIIFYSIIKYVFNTLIRRNSVINLKRFNNELLAVIETRTKFQSSRINSEIFDAEKLAIGSDLDDAIEIYRKIIKIEPNTLETHMKMALALYWRGKFSSAMASHEIGAKLMEELAVEKGLNLFEVRVISNQLWGFYIGHIGLLDVLVKLNVLDLLSPEKRIIFVRPELVSNLCYLNYWRKYLDIIFLDKITHDKIESLCLPISENLSAIKLKVGYASTYSAYNLAERAWISENRPPLLELTKVDRDNGQNILDAWLVPKNSWYVCLHVREGGDFNNTSGPDSDIHSYLQAIEAITSRGGWVIRMGHAGMKPIPSMSNVIDYANTKYKTDWMDVFLWATCKFFIGTSSGPLCIPATFGRPVLHTNAVQIMLSPYLKNSLMLPKLVWSEEQERFLTFREMLDGPTAWTPARKLKGIDYCLVDNTPEEIVSAVYEMMDKLENNDEKYTKLSEMQEIFNRLRFQYGNNGQMTISETFIQKHHALLK
jgi:putative glycosyltransferase (TIGR04372 family)